MIVEYLTESGEWARDLAASGDLDLAGAECACGVEVFNHTAGVCEGVGHDEED